MTILDRIMKIEKRDNPTPQPQQDAGFGIGLPFLGSSSKHVDPMSIPAVFAAVELISNSVAEIPIDVKTKKKDEITVVDDHPLYELFKNNIQTKFMLMKMLVTDMLVDGNGFAYIDRDAYGKPKQIIYCPRKTVTIDWNKRTRRLYYKCSDIKTGRIEPIDMIHLIKNSDDGITGKGLFQYAKWTLDLAQSTEEAAHGYFDNHCHVAGILSTDSPRLTQEQRNKIRDSWREAHGKSGTGMAVLEAGMKYQPVSSSSKEAQMLETRLFNLQDIARFFNISPVLLGDLTHSSYSTIEASLLEFVTHTLYPYITLIENEFSRKLLLPSEKDLYIDLDDNYLIKSDKTSQANYLSVLTKGIISVNEARKQLGLNPVDGADDLIIPYTNLDNNTINKNKQDNKDEQDL